MARISRMTRKRLGEILLEEGLVDQTQVEEALQQQKATGRIVGEILIELGFITEDDVARVVAHQYGLPFIDPAQYDIPDEARDLFPLQALRQYCFVPLDIFGDSILIVINGVLEAEVIEEIERISGRRAHVMVGTVTSVRQAIEEWEAKDAADLTTLGNMLLGGPEDRTNPDS